MGSDDENREKLVILVDLCGFSAVFKGK